MLTSRFPELAAGLGFQASSWRAWRVLLAVVAGQGYRLNHEQTAIARRCLGTDAPFPREPAREVWIICGRRGGKSNVTAFISAMIALLPLQRTAEGETPVVAVLARNTKQARVVKNYMGGIIRRAAPRLIRGETQGAIALATGTEVEVMPAAQASVRGRTFAAVVCDEIAHWWTKPEAAFQDTEVLRAVRPGLATTAGPLWCLSTPWMREGALWEAHERHFGRFEDSVVVWRAPTETMNPLIPREFLESQRRLDPISAATEYDAEWRDTFAGAYLPPSALQGAIDVGVVERPPAW